MQSQPIEFHPSEDVSDDQGSPERKSYLDQRKHPSTVYEVDEEYQPRQSDQYDFDRLKRKDKFCINSQQALAAVRPFDLGGDSGDSMYMLNSSITQSEKNMLYS